MRTSRSAIPAAVLLLVSSMQPAGAADNSWQMATLFQPSSSQLEREQKGRVMIYHGIKDIDVDRAMDDQFERIDAMMFTGTIVTNEAGQPLRDTTTGLIVVEDDGC